MSMIIEHLNTMLKKQSEAGWNHYFLYEDDICTFSCLTLDEFKWIRKELKAKGFKVSRIRVDDSWATKWYIKIRWGRELDLRDIL